MSKGEPTLVEPRLRQAQTFQHEVYTQVCVSQPTPIKQNKTSGRK
jgi:hypothetical protein